MHTLKCYFFFQNYLLLKNLQNVICKLGPAYLQWTFLRKPFTIFKQHSIVYVLNDLSSKYDFGYNTELSQTFSLEKLLKATPEKTFLRLFLRDVKILNVI